MKALLSPRRAFSFLTLFFSLLLQLCYYNFKLPHHLPLSVFLPAYSKHCRIHFEPTSSFLETKAEKCTFENAVSPSAQIKTMKKEQTTCL
ncbi:MAG: hypothetical protein ACTTJI_04535 [Capnocytophaga sp.]|uniref:hypothetical protein n=1 Tax=Capnocytophaga sp. TaxID=44737 RepID=UPI003F9ED8BB